MSLRLALAVLVAMAVYSRPALACMGPAVIFADNFKTQDPAWTYNPTEFSIAGGQAKLTVPAGGDTRALYEGMFIDSGDYCIDVLSPAVASPSEAFAGIIFGESGGNYYAFVAQENGQAAILEEQNEKWLTPVTFRAAPALKTGSGVTNSLRVTWKGGSVSAYINGQLFVTFNLPTAFQNTKIGLYAENETATPISYAFSNLKVTNVP